MTQKYNDLKVKRGSTLSLGGYVTLPSGAWIATSAGLKADGTRVYFSVTLTPPIAPETRHFILIESPAATTSFWPVGILRCDIRFAESSGFVLPTKTFNLTVQPSITTAWVTIWF